MKRFHLCSIAVIIASICAFVTPPTPAWAAESENIPSYSTDLTLDRNGRTYVREVIEYDFSSTERHGIYRNIPIRYQGPWLTIYNLRPTVTNVEIDGAPAQVTKKTVGNDLMVKIGNPNKTVTGTHTYDLTYVLERAVQRFDDTAELNWNAIGTEWIVPIASSTLTLHLPSAIIEQTKLDCFIGTLKSTSTCDVVNRKGSTYIIKPGRVLEPGEALTILVRIPRHLLNERSQIRQALWFFEDNILLFSPFFVGFFCWLIWRTWGRDAEGRGTIIAEYEAPEHLSALEIGTMIDQRVDDCDIAALFITWAVKKYIIIREIPGKKLAFELVKKADKPELSTPEEQALFAVIFAKGDVYQPKADSVIASAIAEVKGATYRALVKKGLFVVHPELIRTAFLVAGSIIGIGGGVIFSGTIYSEGVLSIVAFFIMIINGAIIALTGQVMPQTTQTGALVVEKIKGFKLFLSVTEEARLKFFNAPEKKPEQFEAFLPFALALGVEREWTAHFADMSLSQPSWYEGVSTNRFSPALFVSHLEGFTGTVNKSMMSVPSSSSRGGGSAGSGFGGGGGGSW